MQHVMLIGQYRAFSNNIWLKQEQSAAKHDENCKWWYGNDIV